MNTITTPNKKQSPGRATLMLQMDNPNGISQPSAKAASGDGNDSITKTSQLSYPMITKNQSHSIVQMQNSPNSQNSHRNIHANSGGNVGVINPQWSNTNRPSSMNAPPFRRKQDGSCFVCVVGGFMCFVYITYSAIILRHLVYPGSSTLGFLYLFFFHVNLALLLIAFIQTAKVDPGIVPANWGFYMGDDSKRRRYCKVCNIWKPDRTHHCSACGRCVLNMDHHCPWVNNCVGFMNRKFFIQLLIYALICLIAIVVHTTIWLIKNGSEMLPCQNMDEPVWHCAVSIASFAGAALVCFLEDEKMLLLTVALAVPLVPFTKFHITMLRRNSSTIENMDPATRNRRKYDIGVARNVQQVMGPNVCLWWLPCHTSASMPLGDGVRWSQNYIMAFDSDDE